MVHPKTIRAIFQAWSLLNILAVIFSLNLPYTYVFGTYVNGFQFLSFIAYVNQHIESALLPTVLLWAFFCLGWYLIFKSQRADSLKLQWLCMLLVIVAAILESNTIIDPPGAALSGLLMFGAVSAAGYLALNAIKTLKILLGKLIEDTPLSQILWGGGAMGLVMFVTFTRLHAYGGLIRILVGLQFLILAWISMWLCEFANAVWQKRPSPVAPSTPPVIKGNEEIAIL